MGESERCSVDGCQGGDSPMLLSSAGAAREEPIVSNEERPAPERARKRGRLIWLCAAVAYAATAVLFFIPSLRLTVEAANPSEAFASGEVRYSLFMLIARVFNDGMLDNAQIFIRQAAVIVVVAASVYTLCLIIGTASWVSAAFKPRRTLVAVSAVCLIVPPVLLILSSGIAQSFVNAQFADYLGSLKVGLGLTGEAAVTIAAVLLLTVPSLFYDLAASRGSKRATKKPSGYAENNTIQSADTYDISIVERTETGND